MKRIALYALLATLSFTLFVAVFTPAATIYSLIREDVSRAIPDLQVLTLDGTIWSGSGNARYREFPPADIHWTLAPVPLLSQRADLNATIKSSGLDITLSSSATRSIIITRGTGEIDSSYINPVSQRYGLTFPGRLVIDNLELTSDFQWFTSALGTLHWDGGSVLLKSGGFTQSLPLPPLEARLYGAGEDLSLDVRAPEGLIIQIALKPTGWAIVDLKARLFQITGMPVPPGTNPESSIAVLEEKIL